MQCQIPHARNFRSCFPGLQRVAPQHLVPPASSDLQRHLPKVLMGVKCKSQVVDKRLGYQVLSCFVPGFFCCVWCCAGPEMRSLRQQLQCQPLGGVLSRKTMLEREHARPVVLLILSVPCQLYWQRWPCLSCWLCGLLWLFDFLLSCLCTVVLSVLSLSLLDWDDQPQKSRSNLKP